MRELLHELELATDLKVHISDKKSIIFEIPYWRHDNWIREMEYDDNTQISFTKEELREALLLLTQVVDLLEE